MQVDTIEQRSGYLGLIVCRTPRGAGARQRWIAEMPASAGVHRGNQLDARWKGHVRVGPGDADHPCLKRLTQRIENRTLEFQHFGAEGTG